MGLADAIGREDRVQVTFSDFYLLMREAAKAELLMNAVRCQVPHEYIYKMAEGPEALQPEEEER